ncbi:PilZ domain-containing protein [Megalodesulfovibrio gigas]|uniref:PilZ domain-containing protein n=1 Tax=Megalodesulfovibrio gigas (strain ATCC 19364 / DSM 1382 / NCIMB 9332 / VKM B-1759) TaxID=1121448 RepID=T2GCP1_MEGG1|nr:PilZ domain-containing protein [Megalodesulfovibrio gigas]AGW13602.1 hypothetical protein DGI_1806 [Megalodesulfovibrio gigas DSM 1382 = ATCC 19364]AGW13667.1 hypothetical protein DGI_1878 [Megalodesulfovibrio gigas DSM 1382 = ATCC 19364]
MRMFCPQCNIFLAVGSLQPKTAFRCHNCSHRILPPAPNAAYFACPHCGLRRELSARHIGVLVKCSHCGQVSRTDSLYLPNQPPLEAAAPLAPPSRSVATPQERRRAMRHVLHDLTAYLGLLVGNADVQNISETGAGFAIASPEREFQVGEQLYADLLFQQELVIAKAPLVVVRHNATALGCRFELEDSSLQRRIRLLIDQGLLTEQYLRDPVALEFEKHAGRFQLREHDLY